jgi:hypothetical protein
MDNFTLGDISDNERKPVFEWKPLDERWQKKLLSNNFFRKDSIGDGNCQFRSIETALTNAGYRVSHKKLRKIIAKYVRDMSDQAFAQIIHHYALEQQMGEFRGNWDPSRIKTKRDFIKEITNDGFHFEGDNMTLSILSKAAKVDFVIFDDEYNITDLSNPDLMNDKIIILYYVKSGHYMTIGIKSKRGKVHALFKRDSLPVDLSLILNKKSLYIGHVNQIIKSIDSKVTLNGIMKEVSKTFTNPDRRELMTIIRNVLENEGMLAKIR